MAQLSAQHRLRELSGRTGHDFSSNDYLALAHAPELAKALVDAVGRGIHVGAGGSRLLRGNHPEHEALEAEAATFFGSEAALYLSSGYAANTALFSTLPQRGDLIVYDALVHASAHEGMRLTRADVKAAAHNDVTAFADTIKAWRQAGGMGQIWIAVESLYSMDGDLAPLADLAALASLHDAVMVVDEAHATGIVGPLGRGLTASLPCRDTIITLHTCGKALGAEGALLCGPAIMRDFLINRARPFIFSTAPSPLMAAVVRTSLHMLATEPDRRCQLWVHIEQAGKILQPLGAEATGTQIMPLILGDDARTMQVATQLQSIGFDVRGIRPPTVAPGTSRLRICITLNVTEQDIVALGEALTRVV